MTAVFLTFSLHPGSERVHALLSPAHQPSLRPGGRGWGEQRPRVSNHPLCHAGVHVSGAVFSQWRKPLQPWNVCLLITLNMKSLIRWALSRYYKRSDRVCVWLFCRERKTGGMKLVKKKPRRRHTDVSTDTRAAVCNIKIPPTKPQLHFCLPRLEDLNQPDLL